VISKHLAHAALVSEADFVAAQRIDATATTRESGSHRYLLVGLLCCGVCQRRMDSHWVHGRAGYRCRHGRTAANPRRTRSARTLYLREDRILERVKASLGELRDLGPDAVADYLRANDLTVTCATRICTIDTPARHAAEQTLIMHAHAALSPP
jgi:site-specific DNA recombinase